MNRCNVNLKNIWRSKIQALKYYIEIIKRVVAIQYAFAFTIGELTVSTKYFQRIKKE